MAWPTPQDFNEAVQNPQSAFADSDLRAGQPELTPLGLPRPISGGFACVYKIQSGGRFWAARCFLSDVADQRRRYEAISRHLGSARLTYAVPFSYLPTGIKVQGKSYPLLKMEWIQGESLSSFVGRSIGYPDTLLSLANAWIQMVGDLQAANIAHGDLQHGNVLVVGDRFRLIDYDGMFVPALAGDVSRECGHRNYQHPARTEFDYGLYLDNFSSWVIYLSLLALSVHPELWRNHSGGDECLIFRKEDFLQPDSSALLRDLNRSSNIQLRSLAQLFRSLLNFSPQDIPSLDGNHSAIAVAAVPVAPPPTAPNWWEDYIEPAPTAGEADANSPGRSTLQPGKPDFGWIFESQDIAEPLEQTRFKGSMKEPRIVFVGSSFMVLMTGLLIEMPGFELIGACSGVIGLNLLFCFIRYRNDPAVSEFAAFRKGMETFLRQARDQQAVIDALSAERSEVQELVLASERDAAAGRARSQAALQKKMYQIQATLDAALQRLDQRRSETLQGETTELQATRRSLGDQVVAIDRKLSALAQQEADERDQALRTFRQQEIINHLQRFKIENASIKGIGPVLIRNLHHHGITTAADVDMLRRTRIPGIGFTKAATLENWRNHLMSAAPTSATMALPPAEMSAISNKYRVQRNLLETERERLQTQLSVQVSGIRQKAAAARQSLNRAEQDARDQAAQEQLLSRQSPIAEVTALEKKAAAVKSQAAPALTELSEKLRSAQKQVFALHWQSAKQEGEGQRFNLLKFSNYLKCVIGF